MKNFGCAHLNNSDTGSIVAGISNVGRMELGGRCEIDEQFQLTEAIMTFGKGALLWLIGIPLPIIILLALFWR
jgi:hypothetical protein